jgi:hypothetical protein
LLDVLFTEKAFGLRAFAAGVARRDRVNADPARSEFRCQSLSQVFQRCLRRRIKDAIGQGMAASKGADVDDAGLGATAGTIVGDR